MKLPCTDKRRHSAAAAVTVGAGLWALLAAGCGGDQCTAGQVDECHGNEAWSCYGTSDTPPTWHRTTCGARRYCRVGTDVNGTTSTCAAEPTPEPSCVAAVLKPGARLNLSACTADGRAVTCVAGYVNQVLATCASPELCISTAAPTACAVTSAPDPRCPAATPTFGHTTSCLGDHALTCAAGYLVEDRDCGAGLCDAISAAPNDQGCLASRTPDPRCTAISSTAASSGLAYGCDGNTFFQCFNNLYVHGIDCGIDTCRAIGGSASCTQSNP
jgi:hypothetical protein